eukprot:903071-Rhodomonas_salina.2
MNRSVVSINGGTPASVRELNAGTAKLEVRIQCGASRRARAGKSRADLGSKQRLFSKTVLALLVAA